MSATMPLQAATSSLVGQGHLSHSPEFVRVDLTVKSLCYKNLDELRKETNDLLSTLTKELNALVDPSNPREVVYANSGSIGSSSGFYSSTVSGKLLCKGTLERNAQVSLITTKVNDFALIHNALEDLVFVKLAKLIQPSAIEDAPHMVIAMSEPRAFAQSETIVAMEKQALKLAIQNAKEEFLNLSELLCGVKSYKIISADEAQMNVQTPNPYSGTGKEPDSEDIVFPDIWVTKAANVKFQYDTNSCNLGL